MRNKFEEVNKQLKSEFFGIDEQIDQVIKSFETWMTIKDYQIRPMTVCLWGLTGTGKTALINRTIELLDLNKKKFYIKFGSKTSGIDEVFEDNNCQDTIFILDEFQYFRTRDEYGNELERDENNSTNMIWELLDGGVVNIYEQKSYYWDRYNMATTIHNLKILESEGSTLSDNIIYNKNLASYLNKLNIQLDYECDIEDEKNGIKNVYEEYPRTLPSYGENTKNNIENNDEPNKSYTKIRLRSIMMIDIIDLFRFIRFHDTDHSFINVGELKDFMGKFKCLSEVIKFIEEISNSKPKTESKDYSKALIFVLGNLDECFTMSNDLNSDLDADYFYNQTKKINIINIRKALLKRFRSEQIARLGSTHIIYPSLNKRAFQQIIEKELTRLSDTFKLKFNGEDGIKINNINFSDKIKKLIYKEGVFPIIGARSVFSVINEIISDKFSIIVNDIIEFKNNDVKNVNINIEYDNSNTMINIKYIDSDLNKSIKEVNIKYIIKIDKLRNEKNKGKQAHRAVHEAGHAVCSIILEHSFPEVVYSVTISDKSGGFNLLNIDDMYYDRKNTYQNRIASILAGHIAEKMIFGEDNISNGSGSDIEKATSLLCSLYKTAGFSSKGIANYMSSSFVSSDLINSNYSVIDKNDEINNEIYAELQTCLSLAEKALENQKVLFLKISEYLARYPKMTSKKLKEYTKKYITNIDYQDLLVDKQEFYTKMLNDELNNINHEK